MNASDAHHATPPPPHCMLNLRGTDVSRPTRPDVDQPSVVLPRRVETPPWLFEGKPSKAGLESRKEQLAKARDAFLTLNEVACLNSHKTFKKVKVHDLGDVKDVVGNVQGTAVFTESRASSSPTGAGGEGLDRDSVATYVGRACTDFIAEMVFRPLPLSPFCLSPAKCPTLPFPPFPFSLFFPLFFFFLFLFPFSFFF